MADMEYRVLHPKGRDPVPHLVLLGSTGTMRSDWLCMYGEWWSPDELIGLLRARFP